MAKPARMREPGHAAEALEAAGVPVLGTLEGDAYADGGDRFWLDDATAAIGLGYRTNRKGAERLQELLAPEGITVEAYDMPHDQGPDHVLHLQSFLSRRHRDAVRRLRAARPRPPAPGHQGARDRLDRDRRARAITRWAATSSPSVPASS